MQCLLPVNENCKKSLSLDNGVCDASENGKSAISFSGALRIPVSIFLWVIFISQDMTLPELYFCRLRKMNVTGITASTHLSWLVLANTVQLCRKLKNCWWNIGIYCSLFTKLNTENMESQRRNSCSTKFYSQVLWMCSTVMAQTMNYATSAVAISFIW